MAAVKYPEVQVEMVGQDGNAFAILGRVTRAMRRAGLGQAVRDAYMAEATAGDYNHVLATTMQWVDCDPDPDEGLDFDAAGADHYGAEDWDLMEEELADHRVATDQAHQGRQGPGTPYTSERCGLCGEGVADCDAMGEFVLASGEHVLAHAECGLAMGLPTA